MCSIELRFKDDNYGLEVSNRFRREKILNSDIDVDIFIIIIYISYKFYLSNNYTTRNIDILN